MKLEDKMLIGAGIATAFGALWLYRKAASGADELLKKAGQAGDWWSNTVSLPIDPPGWNDAMDSVKYGSTESQIAVARAFRIAQGSEPQPIAFVVPKINETVINPEDWLVWTNDDYARIAKMRYIQQLADAQDISITLDQPGI